MEQARCYMRILGITNKGVGELTVERIGVLGVRHSVTHGRLRRLVHDTGALSVYERVR